MSLRSALVASAAMTMALVEATSCATQPDICGFDTSKPRITLLNSNYLDVQCCTEINELFVSETFHGRWTYKLELPNLVKIREFVSINNDRLRVMDFSALTTIGTADRTSGRLDIRRSDKLVTIKMPKLANSYSRSDLPELEGFRIRGNLPYFTHFVLDANVIQHIDNINVGTVCSKTVDACSPPNPDIGKTDDTATIACLLNEVSCDGEAREDPHLSFGHGGKADFRGCDGCLWNFLSARDLSVNVKTEDAVFELDGSTVHGSFLTEVHVTSYDRTRNVWANLSYWAVEVGDHNWGWKQINGTCGGRYVQLALNSHRQCAHVDIKTDYASALIQVPEWELRVAARNVWNRISGPKHRLDLSMKPLLPEPDLAAWPHGIIGQSFDGDGLPVNGRQDNYSTPVVYTQAMAEGAIEGTADDYKVNYQFETAFKYSRFDATMATSTPRAMASKTVVDHLVPSSFASSSERGQIGAVA